MPERARERACNGSIYMVCVQLTAPLQMIMQSNRISMEIYQCGHSLHAFAICLASDHSDPHSNTYTTTTHIHLCVSDSVLCLCLRQTVWFKALTVSASVAKNKNVSICVFDKKHTHTQHHWIIGGRHTKILQNDSFRRKWQPLKECHWVPKWK